MSDNYKKIILVTGGAGFIGSAYLNRMVPRYPSYRFVNVDALTYAADLGNITVAEAVNYAFEKADIRDFPSLEKIFAKYAPTHVINFAAESHVDNSITGPHIFIETNVLGTENLLECARAAKIVRFHQISTDEVYGSLGPAEPSTKEDAPLRPRSPYSASKAAADLVVRAYHETFGVDTVITRGSNNYGPGQHREKFMPLFIERFMAGKRAPLYGTGENIRNWIYVDDHVEGVDAAFHKGAAGEIYNLGGADELPNIEVARMLARGLGADEGLIEPVTDRLGHDFRYSLDSSRAARKLGWKPVTLFPDGLRATVAHYKKKLGV
ncbi:MAG: dTDP-glucose 4,6-dehydratase [Patescibacteria group bacterium]